MTVLFQRDSYKILNEIIIVKTQKKYIDLIPKSIFELIVDFQVQLSLNNIKLYFFKTNSNTVYFFYKIQYQII